ncbi:hypothetical protein ACSAZK_12140 [Methanosarcina sp. Mfa9]|uniref:hypothetical protein n=1 Tax=Methanosarcina sp. Mfa9 TaxID=3439063 RepID=UPI003F834692
MNKIISYSLRLLLISFLLITLGGCAEKQNAIPEEEDGEKIEDGETGEEIQEGTAGEIGEEPLVELQFEPIPGILNPWDRWYAKGNIQYIKAPTEKELITAYYGSEYNIEIIDVIRIEACELAYSCDETFFYIVTVKENDSEKMKDLGWKEAEKTGVT